MMHQKILCLLIVLSFARISLTACGSPGKPANGTIKQFTRQESFGEGDSVEYECFAGYSMTPWSSYRRTCINGSWTGQIPVCGRYYRTNYVVVYRMKDTTKFERLVTQKCFVVDSQQVTIRSNMRMQFYVSSVNFHVTSHTPRKLEDVRNHYFNISVASNTTTRYLNGFREKDGYRNFEYYMEDKSSPLANTINVEVDNLPPDKLGKIEVCGISFLGTKLDSIDCGHPDSPLHSVFTFNSDNRTAFFDCKPGYRAVGSTFDTRCTDDFTWTDLNMKCIKSEACGSPGKPANGAIKRSTGQESFGEGDSVEYECFTGYSMTLWSNYKRTCINGSWSGQIPVCERLYRPAYVTVYRMKETTISDRYQSQECKDVDSKRMSFEINLPGQYYVSSVKFQVFRCALLKVEGVWDHYFNISVSNSTTTRYFNSFKESERYCNFEYYMEDNSSPLGNTINIEVNNLPPDKLGKIEVCGISFLGTKPDSIDCGHPDSPLHSVFTSSSDNRTAFFECKPGYRAIGSTFDSRCTDDFKWTELNMKCIKSEELPILETQIGANDLQLAVFLVLPFGLLVFVLSTILGKILYRRWRKRREEQDLIEELMRMKENRQVTLNPYVPIDEQADLLPYSRRWEFPKERLKLGRSLGEGAFGTVMKAEAIGIMASESATTVAVKMVKYQGNNEHLKALMSELKILAYVGHHINIVNLLGAVTKNLKNGELMVITEYCEFGNLRNFLLCQRDRFINQTDPETGDLTTTNVDAVTTQSADAAEKDNQHRTSRDDSKNLLHWKFRNSLHESRQKILSLPPASTCDLISYAFQCARGMEFLSSKKLVHRDLAARNVLLTKNKVIKICDFGLSRKTYEEYAYVRKGKGPLPIKWMAIESIGDRVFTTKSDVWSFGVLLWEIFTLGADPYPGVECNKEFYDWLKGGYRLKKPDLAPNKVHNLMQRTWQENPKDRPTFTEIAEILGNMMEESNRSYYLELNVPNAQFNEAMAQDMQFEPTVVSGSGATSDDVMPEIRESDEKTDPLVCNDGKADAEVEFTEELASLDDSKSAGADSCETTRL